MIKLSGKKRIAIAVASLLCLVCLIAGGATMTVPTAQAATDKTIAEFLSTFTGTKNASVTTEEGILRIGVTGDNGYAEVLTDSYGSGSQWYVKYLTTRNTVMLRMRNDSPARSMKIYFKTRTKAFASSRYIELPLETDGEWHTYFADFSANAEATGELRGLRFRPECSSGSVYIRHISFERETPYYEYAGSVSSCTADGDFVTVKGTLSAEYAGSEVTVYRTGIENMKESLSLAEKIGSVKATGESFEYSFPYHDGEVTMLSSKFIAAVGDKKVSPMFDIRNWRELTDNPYAFTLPDYTLSVLDEGALGDAYTDDTAAIQSAIDKVSAHGGGTVLVPGDGGRYGRRYVVTTVWMKDNVELKIEEGAILWQSWRYEDYSHDWYLGHDVEGIKWGHNGLSLNYPLVYGNEADNIRITGGGTIRLQDTGNQSEKNGYRPTYSEYCSSLMHLVPVGLYNSKNVEFSDIAVLRTNCYHVVVYGCENVYIGNVTLTEDDCLSGDGISIGLGSKNVIVDRCFLYTDDDAIVLLAHSIADPRGVTWWKTKADGEDNRLRNITLRHSAIAPGNIIVLITWGVDASDMTWQAMNGFYVYDNILGTYYASEVGPYENSTCMNLCPSQGYPYGNAGSVPVNNVVVLNNSYRGNVSNLSAMDKTNWVTDCGDADTVKNLLDTGFSKQLGFWEYGGEYKKNVNVSGAEATLDLSRDLAARYGEPSLYQGVYLGKGEYTLSANVSLSGGATARLFAKRSYYGEEIASQTVSSSANGAKISFTVTTPGVYLLGADGGESKEGTIGLSAFSLSGGGEPFAQWFEETFEDAADEFETFGWTKETAGESSVLRSSGKQAEIGLSNQYKYFDLRYEFSAEDTGSKGDATAFVKFGGKKDKYYRLIYRYADKTLSLERRTNHAFTTLATEKLPLGKGRWVQIGLSAGEKEIKAYADGKEIFSVGQDIALATGNVVLGFGGKTMLLDNAAIAEYGKLTFGKCERWEEPTPDPTPESGSDSSSGRESVSAGGDKPQGGGCKGTAEGCIPAALTGLAAAFAISKKRRK